MNLQAQKLDLIARLMDIEDISILEKLKEVLKSVPSNQKYSLEADEEGWLLHSLQESEADYKAGRVHSQQEVEAFFKAKKH